MATISKGIKLSYKSGIASTGSYTDLTNLQEIPELGGERDSIEVTVLSDEAHVFTDGLISYGDSIGFKFLYDKAQFNTLNALTGVNSWKVTFPDNETATFTGSSNVKLDGVGVNAVMTYTLNIKPNSAIAFASTGA